MDINFVIWMLPIIFMLHDFEEIILIMSWKKKYAVEIENSTMKTIPYNGFKSTASMSIAVLIEFIIITIITVFSYLFGSYLVWYGVFFAFTFHFIIHFFLQIRFGHFVPGSFTSFIFFPFSCFILYDVFKKLDHNFIVIAFSCVLTTLALVFMIFILHKLMNKFYELLEEYSKSTLH